MKAQAKSSKVAPIYRSNNSTKTRVVYEENKMTAAVEEQGYEEHKRGATGQNSPFRPVSK